MKEPQILLAEYVQNRSEEAFERLMKCYVDLVYSTAMRLVQGDSHLAEDVTQTVFLDLAKKAKRLPPDVDQKWYELSDFGQHSEWSSRDLGSVGVDRKGVVYLGGYAPVRVLRWTPQPESKATGTRR